MFGVPTFKDGKMGYDCLRFQKGTVGGEPGNIVIVGGDKSFRLHSKKDWRKPRIYGYDVYLPSSDEWPLIGTAALFLPSRGSSGSVSFAFPEDDYLQALEDLNRPRGGIFRVTELVGREAERPIFKGLLSEAIDRWEGMNTNDGLLNGRPFHYELRIQDPPGAYNPWKLYVI